MRARGVLSHRRGQVSSYIHAAAIQRYGVAQAAAQCCTAKIFFYHIKRKSYYKYVPLSNNCSSLPKHII